MIKIFFYSLLLTAGLIVSMAIDLTPIRAPLTTITLTCLSYIMIEVGLEFTIDKKRLRSYGKDYLIAMTTAGFPWLFCALYFVYATGLSWTDAIIISHFAAPTSAAVLFTMLAAAGLGTTWLFKKARILAIFDNIDTVLFMVALQMLLIGPTWELMIAVPIIIGLLWLGYRYLHRLRIPIGAIWNLIYSIFIVLVVKRLEAEGFIEIEILIPAFILGAILFNPHDPTEPRIHAHEHAFIEPEKKWELNVDRIIKAAFMFLVGASLPAIDFIVDNFWMVVIHVIALTLLMNLGKLFPWFCYKREASLRERLALGISLCPRGEVGAGILLVSYGYVIASKAIGIAALSLAFNLLFTGLFIWLVIRLLPRTATD